MKRYIHYLLCILLSLNSRGHANIIPRSKSCASKFLSIVKDHLHSRKGGSGTRITSKEWEFSQDDLAAISKIFQNDDGDLSDYNQRVRRLFELLLETRLRKSSPRFRKKINKHVDDVANNRNWIEFKRYENAYLPFGDKIAMKVGSRNLDDWSIIQFMILLHELTHAIDYGQRPWTKYVPILTFLVKIGTVAPDMLTPALVLSMEKKAIGSQWELVHRITPQYRKRIVQDLESMSSKIISQRYFDWGEDHQLREIAIKSLHYADLSKREFIEVMKGVHEYDYKRLMLQDVYYPGLFIIKMTLIVMALIEIGRFIISDKDEREVRKLPPLESYLLLKIVDIFN